MKRTNTEFTRRALVPSSCMALYCHRDTLLVQVFYLYSIFTVIEDTRGALSECKINCLFYKASWTQIDSLKQIEVLPSSVSPSRVKIACGVKGHHTVSVNSDVGCTVMDQRVESF